MNGFVVVVARGRLPPVGTSVASATVRGFECVAPECMKIVFSLVFYSDVA